MKGHSRHMISTRSLRCCTDHPRTPPEFRSGNVSERGFTLVELLIVVTILPLVIGAISVGLLSVFSLQSSISNRLSDSGDAQVVSANFIKDVQSADLITTQQSSTPQCGTGTQLLGIQWSNGQTVVSYVSIPVSNGSSTTYSLVRQYCAAGNTQTPESTSVISYGLAGSQAAPSISCSSTDSNCSASTQWISAIGVTAVSFAITEPRSNYSYTLVATPRSWNSTSGGFPGGGQPYAPFTLLNPSSCSALRVGQGTLSINVGAGLGNGILGVESTCPGTVTISNGGTLAASSVVTANPTLNSIAPNSKATYPSTEYYNTQFSNPFGPLNAPANPTESTASCSSTAGTDKNGNQTLAYNCPPGIYSSPPSFSGTDTVTINFSGGGMYWFQQGLDIPNNATINFATGTYIFDGTPSLSTGSNDTIIGSNVLFYIKNGSASFGNNNNISLTALTGYQGVAIWNSANGGTLSLGDNSIANLNGGIYIPQGTILSGSNVTMSTTFIVTNTATFGNNLNLTITSP